MVKDHLNNEFESKSDMVKHYGLSVQAFDFRMSKSWSLEDALTTPTSKIVVDHLGNEFTSTMAMCKYYNIDYGAFKRRINSGASLKDALETTCDTTTYDHLGNKFESIKAMCRHYSIKDDTFRRRIKQGWSLEDALTKSLGSRQNIIFDHKGNGFPSLVKMLEYHNVSVEMYAKLSKEGLPLAQILENTKRDYSVTDFKGNSFDNLKAMCEHYNVSYSIYKARIKQGMSMEEALTKPVRKARKKEEYTDHLGQKFNSLGNMCKHWGLHLQTYDSRMAQGWSLKDILETPVNGIGKKQITDHLGKTHESIVAMCKYWNMPIKLISSRLSYGYSLYESLTDNLITKYTHDVTLNPDLVINRCIEFPYFEVATPNGEIVLSKSQIIDIAIKYARSEELSNAG